jgi:hypothetical protein
MLWRLEPHPLSRMPHPALANDLHVHLRYAPLMTVLMQIGSRQQSYIQTSGCPGCRHQRCHPDCRMQLLKRLLVADQVARDVRPIPLGLAIRPYTRMVLALPGPHAHMLDGQQLHPWRDARLWAVWRMVTGRIVVGVALAVGADGPDPLLLLRSHGWYGWMAPSPVVRTGTRSSLPWQLPYGWMWPHAAQILLPHHADSTPTDPIAPPPLPRPTHPLPDATDALPLMVGGQVLGLLTMALVLRTRALLEQIEQPPTPTTIPVDSSIGDISDPAVATIPSDHPLPLPRRRRWSRPAHPPPTPAMASTTLDRVATNGENTTNDPVASPIAMPIDSAPATLPWVAGPDLAADDVAHLITMLVQTPRFTMGPQHGVSVQGLKTHLGLDRPHAKALLTWLDQAGVLAAPRFPAAPWQTPRPLVTCDLAEIAAKLASTPLPTADDIQATFA